MFELTKDQQKHLDSVQWLISGPRGCGKTTLQLVALLNHSFKTGERVYVTSLNKPHSPYYTRQLIDELNAIANSLGIHILVDHKNGTFRCTDVPPPFKMSKTELLAFVETDCVKCKHGLTNYPSKASCGGCNILNNAVALNLA